MLNTEKLSCDSIILGNSIGKHLTECWVLFVFPHKCQRTIFFSDLDRESPLNTDTPHGAAVLLPPMARLNQKEGVKVC